ncbi:MAG TPA: methionyl-tRNA formyltransferase [Stackebrandtia sp.]|uniref:methionyl-tRNA formyltransferase n=1 Tax=Stackebrandtia sp. TaxID=2023065 RepID=UPI002D6BFBF1|nr:methionyl-tRNA formyltransferase [Stackebrandtia sp.]HZE37289.1 methionyl-tRNA formyltransferase [Stackebrandtia sp.]
MKLVFAGTPEVAVPSLRRIADSGHELAAVVTRPDAPSGRGRRLHRSPVGQWADDHGVEVLTPAKPREPEFAERLRAIAPDCVPVVAYGALVPQSVLDIPAKGWVNLHFSLLPAWRGAAPVQHAVLNGDELTGACVFQLEAGLDTGPLFGSVTEPIAARDTSGDLLERLSESGGDLLVRVLNAIDSGQARAQPQPSDGISLAPKVSVDDARVRWDDPAFAVDRRVRAVTPAPTAWTTWDGQRVRLGPVIPDPDGPRLAPGAVAIGKNAVHVGTATESVRLSDIQAPGKKRMPADAWGRGLHADAEIAFE